MTDNADLGAQLNARLTQLGEAISGMKSTTGLTEDVPFEPLFGGMTRSQLLSIVRRYHWMLAEVEAFAPDSEAEPAGDSLQVDQVDRAEDGTFVTMWGTRVRQDESITPYIIGNIE